MARSDKQIEASKKNGRRGHGPITAAGKSKSSQNAKSHGLTGSIDPNEQEAEQLADLEAKLRARYSVNFTQKDELFNIILSSQLRMLRTYQLLDVYAARLLRGASDGDEMLGIANPLHMAMETLRHKLGTGEAPRIRRQDYLLGQSYLLIKNREMLKTKLTKLADYAQRYRGQRDRALIRLERLEAEHFSDAPSSA
jgi:hypothetical protein